ncbi:hypothetical protein ACS0TY_020832 [Phlomoides rotata]
MIERVPSQMQNIRALVERSDEECKDMLRMDRVTFVRLCNLLQNLAGLRNSKHVSIGEKVAMFFTVLAHHTKNMAVKFQFIRSGQTVSKHFHSILRSVLKLHSLLLVQPQPVPNDSSDLRWKKFTGCLGTLDGTHIDVQVPTIDKARYMN